MVQPEDILRKAARIYREYLSAWLEGDARFFPRMVPAERDPGVDLATAIQVVQRLREGSREIIGYGYTIEWRKIRSRALGENLFPNRILFASPEDLLRYVGKTKEFASFVSAVERLRREFPELDAWTKANVRALIDVAAELDGLLEVLRYFRCHPKPDRFARELALAVDTKFIERNKGLLRRWLDLVLPPHAIRADEDHFERRYGLRYVEPQFLIRFLDEDVRRELGYPSSVLSVPLHALQAWDPRDLHVLIVENKVNLMTIPALRRTVALGGLGSGITLLRYASWIALCTVTYWGDVDVDGIEILSRLRAAFPHARSVMMDEAALDQWRDLIGSGNGRSPSMPPHLTHEEQAAFARCAAKNLRLEQERITQTDVNRIFSALFKGRLLHDDSTEASSSCHEVHIASPPEYGSAGG